MPSKFTPEVRGALLERFAAGVSTRDACRAVGLRESTFKNWVTRGHRETEGPYAEFAARVDEAREQARARPEVMDEEELFRVVSEAARKGSVQAMKLRWEMICADRDGGENEEDEPAPLDAVDELAVRRAA